MIKSMTAFGNAERSLQDRTYAVEIRTLNRRYFEVSVRMPQPLLALEDRVRKMVAARIARGRVDVSVRVKSTAQVRSEIEVNIPLAETYHRALCRLRDVLDLDEEVGMGALLGFDGIVSVSEPEVDLEGAWAVLASCVEEALEGIDAMRIAEGRNISQDFQNRLAKVEELLNRVKAAAPSVLSQFQERLMERITALTEGKVEIDPNRLAQEAAFLSDKSDITEEIVRAGSHLVQFRTMMESDAPAGRPLDFLLQELNREVNTIGSKGGDAQLSHMVVNIKSELEKIREQVQNIE